MNNQQIVSRSFQPAVSPKKFARMPISNDLFRDEFDWDESENQYEADSFANNMKGFLEGLGSE